MSVFTSYVDGKLRNVKPQRYVNEDLYGMSKVAVDGDGFVLASPEVSNDSGLADLLLIIGGLRLNMSAHFGIVIGIMQMNFTTSAPGAVTAQFDFTIPPSLPWVENLNLISQIPPTTVAVGADGTAVAVVATAIAPTTWRFVMTPDAAAAAQAYTCASALFTTGGTL